MAVPVYRPSNIHPFSSYHHGRPSNCPRGRSRCRPAGQDQVCPGDATELDQRRGGRASGLYQEWKTPPGALRQYSCTCLCSHLLDLTRSLITHYQMLQYNGKCHLLEPSSEKFRHELYSYENGDSWEFAGLIGQKLSLHRQDEQTAGVDRALEVLQSSVAAAKRERDAQTYVSSLSFPCLDHGRCYYGAQKLPQ